MKTTVPCDIETCSNQAAYLCSGHECSPGVINAPNLCLDCYLGLHSLVRNGLLGEMTRTCPHCGEVFAEPEDVLRIISSIGPTPAYA